VEVKVQRVKETQVVAVTLLLVIMVVAVEAARVLLVITVQKMAEEWAVLVLALLFLESPLRMQVVVAALLTVLAVA
jgi:hypothetical protein